MYKLFLLFTILVVIFSLMGCARTEISTTNELLSTTGTSCGPDEALIVELYQMQEEVEALETSLADLEHLEAEEQTSLDGLRDLIASTHVRIRNKKKEIKHN